MSRLAFIKNIPWHIKICFGIVLTFIFITIFSSWIMPHPPNATNLMNGDQPPVFLGGSWDHPLGTDKLGRDLLSRMIYGTKISLTISTLGLLVGCLVGVALGLISGYMGGLVDKIIMSLVDFQFAVPYTLMLLMGLVLFGTDIPVFIVLLGLAYWENYARMIRGLVLSLRENQYIEAAQAAGASGWYIITKHILPNTVPTILVMLTLYFPAILTLESSLSFLGIGIQPPTSSLGKMVGEGRNYLINQWWISIFPSLIILILALTMQTIGDWLNKMMDITKH